MECPIHRMEQKDRYSLPLQRRRGHVCIFFSDCVCVCVNCARSPFADSVMFIYSMVLRV